MKRQIRLLLGAGMIGSGLLFSGEAIAQANSRFRSAPVVAADMQAIATPEAILAEINRMRESPTDYATWLQTLHPYYEGNSLRFPGERGIRTVEGVAALEGAIVAISQRQPVPPLVLAPGLVQSTQMHLNELLASNRFTLSGLDGSTPLTRAERYGTLEGGRLNELLNEGFSSAEAIVASLAIDDGNRRRSTQDALLSPDITSLGSFCQVGANGKTLCVIDYATQYETRAEFAETQPQNTYAETQTITNNMAPSVGTDVWAGNLSQPQLNTLAEELIAETNLLRSNPVAYAAKLERLRPYYEENLVRVPGHPVVEVTEGVSALDEAIAHLRRTEPISTLLASAGMTEGASDHAEDLGLTGDTGHYGSDGSDPFDRIDRYGAWDSEAGNVAGENITYGQASVAEWHIIQLLVDDNVPDRGHRHALLKPDYEKVGSACEEHPDYRIVCVMTYASHYEEDQTTHPK